jgi:O-methyltransferase involved in polyketide biosynthesis
VWRGHKRLLPLLHFWDPCAPTDTYVNLQVCWLKAIAGHQAGGDDGLAYDLLPPVTRLVVAPPVATRFFPRLHHQNVALRTAYLDRAVAAAIEDTAATDAVTVVTLGGGFDLRSLRLEQPDKAQRATPTAWVEIDLPHVIEQRQRLLRRLSERRPALRGLIDAHRSLGANLSVANEVESALRSSLLPPETSDHGQRRHIVFVIEALMIYIDPTLASALLSACSGEAAASGVARATLCFADRLPNSEGFSVDAARHTLAASGFALKEESWLPKPGLAKHMGVAVVAGLEQAAPAPRFCIANE